ncbi:MAG: hypothetical protein Tp118SUR00d2C21406351_6 [Prokaryotic dsDNA virus sp.]|nr:MAG: hypothetical protein Tp118SUR00d2C21406351_6 [Prokaryotic dsDNA virus sp.]|tara:strand:- start:301 stop:474 length:174 start_codon:yes stop_codon:yes gene_type:complete
MNQVQRIVESKAPLHEMSDRTYKGKNPEYTTVTNPDTGRDEIIKTTKGVPFVRVQQA